MVALRVYYGDDQGHGARRIEFASMSKNPMPAIQARLEQTRRDAETRRVAKRLACCLAILQERAPADYLDKRRPA
jgi:hypothetical protein